MLLSANTAHLKLSSLNCLSTFSNPLVSSANCLVIATNSGFRVFNSFSNSTFTAVALANFSLFCSNWNLAIRNCLTFAFVASNSFVATSTFVVKSVIVLSTFTISTSMSFCNALAWSNNLALSSTSFCATSKSAANLVIFSTYLRLSNSSWSTTFCCSSALIVKLLILSSISCTLAVAFSVCFSVALSSSNTLVALSTFALASFTGCSLLSRTFTASAYAFLKLSRSGTAGNSTVSFDSLLYLAL